MAKKIIKNPPQEIRSLPFKEVFADAVKKHKEEVARFNAMTPEQQKEYLLQREKEEQEIVEVMKQLPGLVRF